MLGIRTGLSVLPVRFHTEPRLVWESVARPRTKSVQCPEALPSLLIVTHTRQVGFGCVTHKTGKGIPAGILNCEKKTKPGDIPPASLEESMDPDLASPHLHVDIHRLHSCPCLLVMASGTTSASPGPLEMACGKHSRMGRSWALGKTWHPGTPSSQGVCSSWDRSRWVLCHRSYKGGCPTQLPGIPCSCPRYLLSSRPCHCVLTACLPHEKAPWLCDDRELWERPCSHRVGHLVARVQLPCGVNKHYRKASPVSCESLHLALPGAQW